MRNEKRIRKIVFKHLDKITKAAISTTRPFFPGMVAIVSLEEIIKRSKLSNEIELPGDFVVKFNKTLESVLSICKGSASKNGLIPSELLVGYMNIVKEGFKSGQTKT